MAAIASLLVVLVMSLLVTRIGAMALELTGMSRESSQFQSRSAFSGVGFTTSEAEKVLDHPVRRRIVMLLMLLSNLGVGAVVATLMLSFMQTADSENRVIKLMTLASGLTLIWMLARSRYIERRLNKVIAWVLLRWGSFQVRDYVSILQLEEGYAVNELAVDANAWLAERSLADLKLPEEGVLVLGIHRKSGPFLGTPTAEMTIHAGDKLILYGPSNRIKELDQRRRGKAGDKAHQDAVEEQEVELVAQEHADTQRQEVPQGPA